MSSVVEIIAKAILKVTTGNGKIKFTGKTYENASEELLQIAHTCAALAELQRRDEFLTVKGREYQVTDYSILPLGALKLLVETPKKFGLTEFGTKRKTFVAECTVEYGVDKTKLQTPAELEVLFNDLKFYINGAKDTALTPLSKRDDSILDFEAVYTYVTANNEKTDDKVLEQINLAEGRHPHYLTMALGVTFTELSGCGRQIQEDEESLIIDYIAGLN